MEDEFPVGKGFDPTAVYRFMNCVEEKLDQIDKQEKTHGFYDALSGCYETLLCSCPIVPLKSSGGTLVDPRYFTPFINLVEAFDGREDYRGMLMDAYERSNNILRLIDKRMIETENMVDHHGLSTRKKYGPFIDNLVRLSDELESIFNVCSLFSGRYLPRTDSN